MRPTLAFLTGQTEQSAKQTTKQTLRRLMLAVVAIGKTKIVKPGMLTGY